MRTGTAMRLLALVVLLLAGCQQQQRIADAEREGLYGSPRNISWEPVGWESDGRGAGRSK